MRSERVNSRGVISKWRIGLLMPHIQGMEFGCAIDGTWSHDGTKDRPRTGKLVPTLPGNEPMA